MDEIKVSIITPVLNRVSTIEQTINSVLNQTYRNIEYIVIDGGSTDGTQEIIEKYKEKIAYYSTGPDGGIYDAINKGIRVSSGDIIGIINSDDWYEDDAVANIISVFLNQEADVVHGNAYMVNSDNKRYLRKPDALDKIWQYMVILHPTVFIRKEIYDNMGMFDTRYAIAADYELMLKLISQGVNFCYINKVLSNFRNGGISEKRFVEAEKEVLEIAIKYEKKCCGKEEKERERILCMIHDSEKLYRFNSAVFSNPLIFERIIKETFGEDIKNIVIFGAGIWGERYGELLKKTHINIVCYCDNNTNGRDDVLGIRVIGFDAKTVKTYPILIAVRSGVNEIESQIKKAGAKLYTSIDRLVEYFNEREIA